ncbi:beta-1,4-glucuronyltransferase 1 [Eurosta solidaginis]|uniref:beta-1,4-glucuronyltransferase 1 n=1 Tax=Eurosta solidaginis TaxID=178769 RepID=UPI0035307D64
MVRFEPLGQKMFTRRNWLLRCSILINIVVVLYICSHVMVGNGSGFNGSTFFLQDRAATDPANALLGNNEKVIGYKLQPPLSLSNAPPPAPTGSNDSGGGAVAPPAPVDIPPPPTQNQASATSDASNTKVVAAAPFVGNIGGFAEPMNTSAVSEPYIVTGDEKDLEERLRSLTKCYDRDYKPDILQRGDFWVLKNYVRAEHGALRCHEAITYTTHADYTFLDNLVPLLERWNAPVSIAMHAPGTDYQPTIDVIKYLRECLPESNLVRSFTTFHLYFSTKHIPKQVLKQPELFKKPYNCTLPPPYANVSSGHLYKSQKKLLYPVNVGRNIARDAALTHFILASDIELYPNPGLVRKFLEMIARNEAYLQRKSPRVFPIHLFEVEANATVPRDKTELLEFLRVGKAIPFHKRVCASCHGIPQSKEWLAANETEDLGVFHIGKRTGYYRHWEPIYIGTHADPHYDERLSWEGKSDKMTQGYSLCALDYEFHILDNAFLVHKPGIKQLQKDNRRAMLAGKTNQLIRKIIYPELKIMYGVRQGCVV